MSQNNEPKDRFNVTDIAKPFDIRCDIKMAMVAMRDGVKLHTAIYFPPDFQGKAPVLLARSPYTRTNYFELPHADALKHNCISIMQACRGSGWSEGSFYPVDDECEKNDIADLFQWLSQQEWFNGRCIMYGGSYPGWMQWCAQRSGFKGLAAISPRVAPIRQCSGAASRCGIPKLRFPINWNLFMHHRRTYGFANLPALGKLGAFSHLPAIEADKFIYGKEIKHFRDFLRRAEKPAEFFANYQDWFKDFHAPAFISGGWFDMFKDDVLESFRLMRDCAATEEARKFTRLTFGPWAHGGLVNPEYFGAENNYTELLQREEKFLFGMLDDPTRDPLGADDPVVKYFILGENRWYTAADWPPPGVKTRSMYLHSNGNANTSNGDGVIDYQVPGNELPDHYTSTPADPVTAGVETEPVGCYDRSTVEKRSDVLVYTTETFTKPLALTGKVKLKFSAQASTVDTDFFATLTDVLPDGRSMLLTIGGVRARYRNGLEKEEFITPGKIYTYEIDLGHIAVKFPAGHAMRLEIHGQEFPLYERNANNGHVPFTAEKLETCACTIYHDAEHPAELILPFNAELC